MAEAITSSIHCIVTTATVHLRDPTTFCGSSLRVPSESLGTILKLPETDRFQHCILQITTFIMESIQPDTSMPSEEAPRTSKAELLTLQLPLGPNQIREQARRFEEFLTRASSAVESQGTTINFKVTITSHASEDILQAILPQAAISTTANIDSAAGAGHPTDTPDPMTDAPALPSADSEGEALATEVTPIYPTQPTETDAEGNGGVSQESPVTTSPPPQCKICMDDLTPESTIMINCGCIYCGTCLNSHIMHGLSSRANYPARCCGAEGIDIGDTQPYLTFEVILRWSEVEAEYKERMPMYCQNKECSAHIPEGRLGVERKFIECNSCHTDTCKECKQWRFDHCGEDLEICQEDIVSKEDRELANSEKWSEFYFPIWFFSLLTHPQSSVPDARTL